MASTLFISPQIMLIKLVRLHFSVNAFPPPSGILTLATRFLQHVNLSSPTLVFLKMEHLTPLFVAPVNLARARSFPSLHRPPSPPKPLQLVRTDVWGPAPIPSISGFRYYVLFVDDFSRYSWLYPLYNKSDVYDVFISFKTKVENLLEHKIKILRSDGGGEFPSSLFEKSLSEYGITHQMSCPHTIEQNVVFERQHKNIVETGLTLLAHAHPILACVIQHVNVSYQSLAYQGPFQHGFHLLPNPTPM